MAYRAPSPICTGDLCTASIWNADVVANAIALHAGAMSVTSQAVGDILYASSTTQLGRIAAVATGQILTSAGTGTVPAWSTDLVVSGAGPHAIGGSTVDYARLNLVGSYTSGGASTVAFGTYFGGAITGHADDSAGIFGTRLDNSVVTAGNATTVAQLSVNEPQITVGSGTVTNSASLYVTGAASEATNDYAVWVDAGDVRIDEDLGVGTETVNYTSASRAITLQAATQARLEIVGTRTSDDVIGEFWFANRVSGTNNALGLIRSNRVGADNSGSLSFHTYNAGSVVTALTMGAAGKIGIGTVGPGALLDIAHGTGAAPATSGDVATNTALRVSNTGSNNTVLDMGADSSTNTSWIQSRNRGNLGSFGSYVYPILLNPNGGDVYSAAYADYYSSSTIVGWSSLTSGRRRIMYKTIGKLVFVWFHLEGTSDATTVSFTLPYTSTSVGFGNQFHQTLNFTYDNTTAIATPGQCGIDCGTATATCDKTCTASGGWTASGSKIVSGQFIYEMA